MINEFLDAIQTRVGGYFTSWSDWFYSPAWKWVTLFALFLLGCGLVMWFFGWLKPVRIAVSVSVASAAIFLLGGLTMWRESKGKLEEARNRVKELERQKKERDRQNSGGGWFGRP